MADLRGALGLGGGQAKKTKLVADLTQEYEKLNRVLSKTEEFSKKIFDNLKKAKEAGTGLVTGLNGATGGGDPASSMSFVGPFVQRPGGGGGTQADSAMSFNTRKFAAGAFVAANQAINPETYVENEIARRRFAFMSGQGNTPANNAMLGQSFQTMMNKGTATSEMDAANAAMLGASMGMGPGLKNYGTVMSSVASMSNIMPGAGLENSMGAFAALNSAQSVNKLRMIGIQVRNDQGLPRDIEAVARDVWAALKRADSKGGTPITAEDIDASNLPGGAVYNMLDQYFGQDPYLRAQILSYLKQFAQAGTGKNATSKSSLQKTNANPTIAQSSANRLAKEYGVTNAYTSAGVAGVEASNAVLAGAAEAFSSAVNIFQGAVLGLAALQTLAGAGGGALGSLGASAISSFGGGGGGGLLGRGRAGGTNKYGGATNRFGRPAKYGPATKPGMFSKVSKLGKFGAIGSTLFGGLNLAEDAASGHGWGSEQFSADAGSMTGGIIGSIAGSFLDPFLGPFGTILGGMAGSALGGWLGGMMGTGGEGVGGEGINGSGYFSPLKGGLSTPKDGEYGNFASFRRNKHQGHDFVAPEGTEVYAINGGKVSEAWNDQLGKTLTIDDGAGMQIMYAHLKQYGVANGATVKPGDPVALSGNTGSATTGAHLHVKMTKGGAVGDVASILGMASAPTGSGVYSDSSASSASAASSASSYNSSLFGESKPLFNMEGKPLFGSGGGTGGEGFNTSGSVSYGGVTVHINVPKGTDLDEHKLAREVKRILQDEEQIRMAVIR